MLFQPPVQQPQRKDSAAGLTGRECGRQTGLSEETVEEEHQGNIEHNFPYKGMKEGSSSIAHRLQTVGGVVIDELDRGRNAADSQEKAFVLRNSLDACPAKISKRTMQAAEIMRPVFLAVRMVSCMRR